MLNQSFIANQLLYTTVRIESTYPNGSIGTGTGFFFEYCTEDSLTIPVIVTNNHVVKGSSSCKFFVHVGKEDANKKIQPTGEFSPIVISDSDNAFISHDNNADICVMPFIPIREAATALGFKIYKVSIQEGLIPTKEQLDTLSALEKIVMVGYPNGLWDDAHNFPILRTGTTASHPAVDFKGKPEGIIDIAAFPGSSGSPVLICNQGSYETPKGVVVGSRCYFMGIVFATHIRKCEGDIIRKRIPVIEKEVSLTGIPINLGCYIKSSELMLLKEQLLSRIR